jgi:hypothetical protein
MLNYILQKSCPSCWCGTALLQISLQHVSVGQPYCKYLYRLSESVYQLLHGGHQYLLANEKRKWQ